MGQANPLTQRQTFNKPVFYLLAGPNGAGKSTLYKALVRVGTIADTAEFVNADLYEAQHLQQVTQSQARSEQARQWADARRTVLLKKGQSFVSETVFSHPSKLALIQEAQAQGFFVMLLVVALDQPLQLLDRVAQRVAEGGHPVPADRILARYPRTLTLLTQAVRMADAAVLYDAQDVTPGTHTAVAMCKRNWSKELVYPLPLWVQQVLGT